MNFSRVAWHRKYQLKLNLDPILIVIVMCLRLLFLFGFGFGRSRVANFQLTQFDGTQGNCTHQTYPIKISINNI